MAHPMISQRIVDEWIHHCLNDPTILEQYAQELAQMPLLVHPNLHTTHFELDDDEVNLFYQCIEYLSQNLSNTHSVYWLIMPLLLIQTNYNQTCDMLFQPISRYH